MERHEGLTTFELTILVLVADGLSNKEIGLQVNKSGDMVKQHISTIIAKLHARDRTNAAAIGFREGLIT